MPGPLLVLGPQRPAPNLAQALADAGVSGPVALITAGWRSDEAHIGPITEHLVDHPVHHLPLYAWFDALRDTALGAQYRARSERIYATKRAYRVALDHALQAHASMVRLAERETGLDAEVQQSLEHLRAVDAQCLERLDQVRAGFPELLHAWTWADAADHHGQVRETLERCNAVLIAGGHVGVLRNRLEFWGLEPLLTQALWAGKALVSWSAGAMALSERVVLFYDDPPDGQGQPELLDSGLGLLPDAVFFPHARRRLRLDDAPRMARLAARFAPATCRSVEAGGQLVYRDGAWADVGAPGSSRVLGGGA